MLGTNKVVVVVVVVLVMDTQSINLDVNKLICQQPLFINSQHANLSLV